MVRCGVVLAAIRYSLAACRIGLAARRTSRIAQTVYKAPSTRSLPDACPNAGNASSAILASLRPIRASNRPGACKAQPNERRTHAE